MWLPNERVESIMIPRFLTSEVVVGKKPGMDN
jgi:hypothetical protein